MTHAPDATALLAGRLLAASLEGAAIVTFVWIALRVMPTVSPAVRSAVWWLAALKFVIGVLPLPAVSLSVLPSSLRSDAGVAANAIAGKPRGVIPTAMPVRAWPERDRDAGTSIAAGATPSLAGTAATGAPAAPAQPDGPAPADATDRGAAARWRWGALAIWGVIVGLHAVRIALSARYVRGVVARAIPWSDEELEGHHPLIKQIGVRRVPDVRTSCEVTTPLVAGIRRPVVLMPAGEFTPDERAMMLCHELMHVRRRDVAWGWIPAAAERLFFFHPFARLAAREYLVAREAACDAVVVRTLGVGAADYGRLLVKLGVSPAQPSMVAGGSSRSASSLRRRLEMLHFAYATVSRRSAWTIVLAAAAIMPLQLGARDTPVPASSALAPQRALPPAAAQPARDAVPAREAAQLSSRDEAQRALEELQARANDEQARAASEIQRAAEQAERAGNSEVAAREAVRLQSERAAREQMQREQAAREVVRLQKERAAREVVRAQAGNDKLAAARAQRDDIERLRVLQEAVARELQQIANRHRVLLGMQQQLAEQAQVLRREVERQP